MKRFLIFVMLLPGSLFGQFKNIVLDENIVPSAISVAVNPKEPTSIIVAGGDALYITSDGGETWKKSVVSTDSSSVKPQIICDRKGDYYYFYGTEAKENEDNTHRKSLMVKRSSDGGASWDEGNAIPQPPATIPGSMRVTTDKKGDLFLTWVGKEYKTGGDDGCKDNILFSMSGNRGKKWEDPVHVNQFPGNCEDGHLAVEGAMPAVTNDKKIYITWTHNDSIYLDRSYNDGKMWLRNDINVTTLSGQIEIPGMKETTATPVLISDVSDTRLKGMLYLSWTDQRYGIDDADIWFTSSHNGGDTWASATKVNDDTSGKHQFRSWMVQDPTTGFIYVVFYDRRNYEDNNTDVYLAYSKNGGRSFKNVKISEEPFLPEGTAFSTIHLNIDAYGGQIVPVWTRINDEEVKIVTTVLTQAKLDKLEEEKP